MGIAGIGKLSVTGGLIGELFGQLDAEKSTHLSGSDQSSAGVTFDLEIDPARHHYLQDHAIGGKLVLPATCALEMLCEAAAGLYPGYEVVFVDDFQILGGITFEDQAKSFRLVIKQTSDVDNMVEVAATLFSQEMRYKIHFRAKIALARALFRGAANLVATPASGDTERGLDLVTLTNSSLNIPQPDDIPDLGSLYTTDCLFHGPLFQGISIIKRIGKPGIEGTVIGTDPVYVVSPPNSYNWVFDPILLDSAMQLAAVWVKKYMDMQTLPTGLRSMFFARKLDLRKVTAAVYFADDVVPSDLICDLVIRDQQGALVAAIKGLTGVAMRTLTNK